MIAVSYSLSPVPSTQRLPGFTTIAHRRLVGLGLEWIINENRS